ncbi:MAG: hypothetical protein HOW97_37160 [Catenulispora sp.]|nr:hypothetical protein [Catenulispora sp.]
MSDEQNTDSAQADQAEQAGRSAEQDGEQREQSAKQEQQPSGQKSGSGRDDVVDTVIGLAVLGLGAALMSGSMSVGGVLRGLTRGTPPRTPPIGPNGPGGPIGRI